MSDGTHKARVIISSSRSLHAAESNSLDTRQNTVFANEPVSILSLFIQNKLLDHDAKCVRDMLVQGTSLGLVIKRAGVFSHCMSELVADDIDAAREVCKELSTITVDHLALLGVPDCNER